MLTVARVTCSRACGSTQAYLAQLATLEPGSFNPGHSCPHLPPPSGGMPCLLQVMDARASEAPAGEAEESSGEPVHHIVSYKPSMSAVVKPVLA